MTEIISSRFNDLFSAYFLPASVNIITADKITSIRKDNIHTMDIDWIEDDEQTKVQIRTRDNKIFVINACAVAKSKNWRNWTIEGYAAIADHVSDKTNMQVVLTGGNSQLEKDTADEILSSCKISEPVNLVAATSIDELVAILHLADIVLAPDTGPVHIASALGTDTIGLYASTNPDRAGPYNHKRFVVNRYPQALLKYNNKTVDEAAWGERIKTAECMALITVDDVIKQIQKIIEKQT